MENYQFLPCNNSIKRKCANYDRSYGAPSSKSPSLPFFCGVDGHPLTSPCHTQKKDKSRNESLQGMAPSSFFIQEFGCFKRASKLEAMSGRCNKIWLAQQQLVRNRPKTEEAPSMVGATPPFLICWLRSNPALSSPIWLWPRQGPWWPAAVCDPRPLPVHSLSLLTLSTICCSLEHPASPSRHPGRWLFMLSHPKHPGVERLKCSLSLLSVIGWTVLP